MRVVAGSAKGRPLYVPKGLDIRPTTDKVKAAIFSMLAAEAMRRQDLDAEEVAFPYRRVLDLYAGSGALGIEALSRGAEFVDFVEANARARSAIRANLERTGFVSQASIHGLRAQAAVSTFSATYDLILADPPYDEPTVPEVLETIGRNAILKPGGILVLEHARSRDFGARVGKLQPLRTRNYGTTAVSLFRNDEN
ncbi:MAG TPA: 16S rRNA (guanine(966)-N(2))-methyltransferase RsmD [Chloroflexota bacterium]|nr:16S rRNA (guanine(966)-N(2))-methyltransferase RsmD [Chloroflexota bacterium]